MHCPRKHPFHQSSLCTAPSLVTRSKQPSQRLLRVEGCLGNRDSLLSFSTPRTHPLWALSPISTKHCSPSPVTSLKLAFSTASKNRIEGCHGNDYCPHLLKSGALYGSLPPLRPSPLACFSASAFSLVLDLLRLSLLHRAQVLHSRPHLSFLPQRPASSRLPISIRSFLRTFQKFAGGNGDTCL